MVACIFRIMLMGMVAPCRLYYRSVNNWLSFAYSSDCFSCDMAEYKFSNYVRMAKDITLVRLTFVVPHCSVVHVHRADI